MLTAAHKAKLLELARQAIASQWSPGALAGVPVEAFAMLTHAYAGVFVSLHKEDKLRGCIGNIDGVRDVAAAIVEMAQAAAFRDPRFSPLRQEELAEVRIEISLLFPLEPVTSPEEIEIGRHGLMIRLGKRQGLLLPQVAMHRGWNAEAFLRYVCRKADLPPEVWKDPAAKLFRFGAEVFSDLPNSPAARMGG